MSLPLNSESKKSSLAIFLRKSCEITHLGPAGVCEGAGPVELYLQGIQDTGYSRRALVKIQCGWCTKNQRL